MDLIGRHMKGFFDYGAVADEVHELKGLSEGTNNGEERGSRASEHRYASAPEELDRCLPPHYFPLEANAGFRGNPAMPGGPDRVSSEAAWPGASTFSSALRFISRLACA